ncbi:MAG: thioesterase [Magnetovibrio sp.]|nr:thioesterase [Magnetovibrio sp.]|tara:strand:- start:631 stop:1065 length:435 start_codon:yes stop_codon:yes gene_type:complete
MSNQGNLDRLDKRDIQAIFKASPFISTLNLEVLEINYESQEITVRMPQSTTTGRKAGTMQFHGGPLAAFIDIVGDFAIGMMIGGGVPTMNLRIDYLKPAVGDAVIGNARIRRRGRTTCVIDIDVCNEEGALVAIGRGTYVPIKG